MDKYEYKLKLEQLKNLVEEKDYKTAAEIADTINWRKVKSAATLCMVGEIYDRNKQYENSRDILLMAYDRATVGRNIIYRLALVNLKMGKIEEAKEYYDEFLEVAPYDNLKYVLRYQIARIEGASLEQQIAILEEFKSREYTEEWAFELAYLYHRAGNSDRCVEVCDELVLWFGDGKCVEKALELKMLYQPLDKYQEEKYREFKSHQEEEAEVDSTEMMESGQIIQDTVKIPDLTASSGRFNTLNLQEELAKGMQQILDADSKETVTDTMDNIKKIVEEIPYLQISQEEEPEEEEERYGHIETDEEIDDFLQTDFQEMLAEDWDGQISFAVPGGEWREPQVMGQISIDDVLATWEKTRHAAEVAMAMAQQRKLESAKVRALQEAEELMERLNQIIPKLNAGVTPQELLAERYLQNGEGEYNGEPDLEGTYGIEEGGPEGYYGMEEGGQEGYYGMQEGEQEAYYGIEGQEAYYGIEGQEGTEGYYNNEEGEPEGYYNMEGQQGPEGYYDMEEGEPEGYYDMEEGEAEGTGGYYNEEGQLEGYYGPEGVGGYYNEEGQPEGQPEGQEVTQEELEALPADPSAEPGAWQEGGLEAAEGLSEISQEGSKAILDSSTAEAEASWEVPQALPEEAEASWEGTEALPEEIEASWEGTEALPEEIEASWEGTEALPEEIEASWEGTEALPEEIEASWEGTEALPEEIEASWEGSEALPEETEVVPEGLADLPKTSGEEPKAVPEEAEVVPEGLADLPKTSGEEPKAVPEEPAGLPKPPQKRPKAVPEEPAGLPKPPQRGPKVVPEGPPGLAKPSPEGLGAYREPLQEKPEVLPEALQEKPGALQEGTGGLPRGSQKRPGALSGDTQALPEIPRKARFPKRPFSKSKAAPQPEQEIPLLEYAKKPPKPKKKDAESYLESAFRAAKASREEKNYIPTVKMEPLPMDGGRKESHAVPGRQNGDKELPTPEISMEWEEGMVVPEIGMGSEMQPVRKLTEGQREIFSYFVSVTGMEQQLCQVLEGTQRKKRKDNTSSSGNILIMGGRGSGKTILATNIIKAIHTDAKHPPKVGKIMGESLNQKDLSQLLKKIAGGYLIIEKAGEMSPETITRLSLLMEQNTEGLLFILEDARKQIEKVLSQDANFAKKFTERIKIPVFTSDELVEFAKAYAREQDCEIDDMGILALYNRISNIQKLDEATTLTEVKEIVDLAISSAERGGLKKLFGGKKFSPEGYLYLREKDFEE